MEEPWENRLVLGSAQFMKNAFSWPDGELKVFITVRLKSQDGEERLSHHALRALGVTCPVGELTRGSNSWSWCDSWSADHRDAASLLSVHRLLWEQGSNALTHTIPFSGTR